MLQKKLEEYVDIKTKIKQLESILKNIENEIKPQITDKVSIGNYILQKRSRLTYTVKEGVDVGEIASKFPSAVEIKVNGKELFKIAENPRDIVEEKVTEYLEVKESKIKKSEDLDF